MQRCSFCFHGLAAEDDVVLCRRLESAQVRVHNVRCHYICWLIRQACATPAGKATRTWKTDGEYTAEVSALPACSLCREKIAPGDTAVCFKRCARHAQSAFHLACMTVLCNPERKMGCPICNTTRDSAAACIDAWAKTQTAPPAMRRRDFVAAPAAATTATAARPRTTAAQRQTAATNEAVLTTLLTGASWHDIAQRYEANRAHMIEPVFATPLRKLAFDINQRRDTTEAKTLTTGFVSLCDVLLTRQYTPADLLAAGLTFDMLCGHPDDRVHLSDGTFTWQQLADIGATVLSLALLGIDLECLSRRPPTAAELRALKFHPQAYIASGASHESYLSLQEALGYGAQISLAADNPIGIADREVLTKWKRAGGNPPHPQ